MSNPTPRRAPILRLLLTAMVLVVLSAGPAAAHAVLVSANPPDGARLDESPAKVTLTFDEHVTADLGGVKVLDKQGHQVQDGAATANGKVVSVRVKPDLPDGTYVVSYRVVSADGHPVRGATVFAVGDVTLDPDAASKVASGGSDHLWNVVGAIGRALAYGGALLAAGGALFLLAIHRDGDERPGLIRIVRVGAVVGALAALVALPVQAALGTGQGPGSLFDPGVLGNVSADGVGLSVAFTALGLAVVAAVISRQTLVATIAGAVAVAGFALTGHTRSGSTPVLTTAVDLVHLLVVAAWTGGLVLLWRSIRWRRRSGADEQATVALVGRYSALATVTVLLVGVSGFTLGWDEVRTLDGLTDTTYGRILLAKLACVAVIAALGAYNHFRLIPALTSGKVRAALSQLGQTVRLEVLLVAVVVAVTSILVVVTPARSLNEGGVVERTTKLGDIGSVQVTIAPAKAGFNEIHLYLFDTDDRPADLAESVTLRMSLPSADLGPFDRPAVRAGPAHFQLNGDDLAVGGTWTIEVHARIDEFTEETGTVQVPIAG